MNRWLARALLIVPFVFLFASHPAFAQSLSIDMGDGAGSSTGRIVQLLMLLTVLMPLCY